MLHSNFSITSHITCIIPTLNEENSLPPLILSLHKQTLRPLEIIIIDGGSNDETIPIINLYKEQFNDSNFTIKLFRELHSTTSPSPANARNIGLNNAKGEYILFLDADMVLPNKNTLESLKRESVGHNLILVELEVLQDTPLERFITKIVGFGKMYMYKRSFIGDYRFNPKLGFGEDRLFTYQMLEKNKVFNIPWSPISILRHYPHTLHELKSQAKWYGRTIRKYMKVVKKINPADFKQQVSYTIYNLTITSILILLLPSLFFLPLTLSLIFTLFFLILFRFMMYDFKTSKDFLFFIFYTIFFAMYFTKGFISSLHITTSGRNA